MLPDVFSDRTSDAAGDDFTHAVHCAPVGSAAPGGRFAKCAGPVACALISVSGSDANKMMLATMPTMIIRRRAISFSLRGCYGAFPGHCRQEARSQTFSPGSSIDTSLRARGFARSHAAPI